MKLKIIKIKKAKRVPVELIGLHIRLKNKCQPHQKVVYFKNVPMIVKKNYWDFILDVILKRKV